MIKVDSLLYKIDQKLNKLSTNEHQQIHLEDKILALNEAQIKLIKQKVDGISVASNGMGMDSFRKRYEDLQGLIEDYHSHPLKLSLVNSKLNEWSADLNDLSPEYLFYVDGYILATKGRCKNRMIWMNKELVKHGDIQFLINNVHYKPSFEYQETFNSVSSGKISVYTDGTFTPSKLYLMYIRIPNYIDKEGYINLEGGTSSTVDCELPYHLEDELADLAVKLLAGYIENSSALQIAEDRIRTNE